MGRAAVAALALAGALAVVAALALEAPSASSADPRACGGKRSGLIGTPGDDVIQAPKWGRWVISGLGGNDVIYARNGRDIICGGDGNDLIHAGGSADRIRGGDGSDYVDAGSGRDAAWGDDDDDLIRGRDGGDRLDGGAGDDRVYGDLVDDWLRGGPGGDVLIGGQGVDLMRGEPGNDLLRGDTNRNVFDGGPGADTASFATATPGTGETAGYGVVVYMRIGTAIADGHNELHGIEHVLGSSFKDELNGMPGTSAHAGAGNDVCSGFAWTSGCGGGVPSRRVLVDLREPRDPGLVLVGGGGGDRWSLTGTPGRVRIDARTTLGYDGPPCSRPAGSAIDCAVAPRFVVAWGDDGPDSIEIHGGLPGEATVDIDGGFGDDRLSGGPAGDVIVDRGGEDRMTGAGGSDALSSGPGRDHLRGGAGNDQLVSSHICHGHLFSGGKGKLDIAGFARASFAISASRGGMARARKRRGGCRPTRIQKSSEVLEGGRFGDRLSGTRRADFLIGGNGGDLLIGRGGRDQLNGGGGHDRCVAGRATLRRRSCERA